MQAIMTLEYVDGGGPNSANLSVVKLLTVVILICPSAVGGIISPEKSATTQ